MPTAGPYGSTMGTQDGPGTIFHLSTVTKIIGYGTSNYVYGLKLYWGMYNVMFGQTNGLSGVTLDLTDDPVMAIRYETASGLLRGLKFTTLDDRHLEVGVIPSTNTAFNNTDYEFTDMITYTGSVNNVDVIWGIYFYYVDTMPLNLLSKEMALPSLAIMAHACVVAQSFMKVSNLQETLSIAAPSAAPPATTSPSDAQLWYRTVRAQENCKDMYLVYLPSILVASTMGYHAFGKWVPRTVGAMALLGAFFRHQYLKASSEDADKGGKSANFASLSMKPIFYMAVLSSGYVVGRELYQRFQGGAEARRSVRGRKSERSERSEPSEISEKSEKEKEIEE